FKGFDAAVTSLAFAPDGRRLVSGLDDSTLLVWDVGAREASPPIKLGAQGVAKAWADLGGADAPKAFRARATLVSSPDEAIALLEDIATPAARQVLETLSKGALAARQTQESRAALERLSQCSAKAPGRIQ